MDERISYNNSQLLEKSVFYELLDSRVHLKQYTTEK